MDKVFLTILNMSLTGAFIIAAIIIARLPLKKAPKIISYCLWTVAGFRLVFPFTVESVFSLLPFKAQPIPPDIATQAVPRIDSGIPFVNNAVSGILPAATPQASVNPLQIWTAIGAYVWLIGVVVMFIYGVMSYALLKRKMRRANCIGGNTYEADNIQSPFVLGIFTPKIYLPTGFSEHEREYILLHERTHIRRHDHVIKFAAYFILCLHWFNPLAWAAFLLMGVDMEMSCDERVLKEMGSDTKKDYSLSLLSLATERRIIGGSPLAFSEGGLKQRIKNVLNFKKPSRVIITLAVVLVAVLTVGFAVNRVVINDGTVQSNGIPSINAFVIDKASQDDISPVWLLDYSSHNTIKATEQMQMRLTAKDFDVASYVIYLPDGTIFDTGTRSVFDSLSLRLAYSTDGNSIILFAPFTNGEFIYAVKVINKSGDETLYCFRVIVDSVTDYPSSPLTYVPTKWLDYYNPRGDGPIPYDRSIELELPEFPDTVFYWTAYEIKAVDASGERVLFDGLPVWNVFLADLNGDWLPELCATVSFGSGIVDTRVLIYDYANDKGYDLSDRMYYDYSLSLVDGQLVVTQTGYNRNGVQANGNVAIIEGELEVFGIDRTKPELEPKETTPPMISDPLPDFTAFDDAALLSYCLTSDGAYSEGSYAELIKRFDADPLGICEGISEFNESEQNWLCKGLIGEYIIEERVGDLETILSEHNGLNLSLLPQIGMVVNKINNIYDYKTGKTTGTTERFNGTPVFEVTNVLDWHTETFFDHGTDPVEVIFINYLPGAELRIIDPDMSDPQYAEDGLPHAQWGLGVGDTSDNNVKITDEIKIVPITPDLRGIYNLEASLYVVRFVEV